MAQSHTSQTHDCCTDWPCGEPPLPSRSVTPGYALMRVVGDWACQLQELQGRLFEGTAAQTGSAWHVSVWHVRTDQLHGWHSPKSCRCAQAVHREPLSHASEQYVRIATVHSTYYALQRHVDKSAAIQALELDCSLPYCSIHVQYPLPLEQNHTVTLPRIYTH
jgi:hypothetical protein